MLPLDIIPLLKQKKLNDESQKRQSTYTPISRRSVSPKTGSENNLAIGLFIGIVLGFIILILFLIIS